MTQPVPDGRSSSRCLVTYDRHARNNPLELQPPVVAAHDAAAVLEVVRAEQREAELAADRVGGRVVDRRERVREAQTALRADDREDQLGRPPGDAASLELGH